MKKAEAKVPREATQTAVKNKPALHFQSTEVEAECAEEPEDTPEDEAGDGGGVQVVQGERGRDQQDKTPDDGGGVIVPTQRDDNVPRTQLDGYHVQDNPPAGGGVQDVQGDVEDRFDDTADKSKAGSFMMQKTVSVEDKSNDEGDKFIDVADMSKKRVRAETPTTVRRDHVHVALAVKEDADQEGRDDHVAEASQDNGDGAA